MKSKLKAQQRIAVEAEADREKLTLRIKELEDKVQECVCNVYVMVIKWNHTCTAK